MGDGGWVMDRRGFVTHLSAAALVAAGVDPSRIPHPPSRISSIGLQLYTVRNLMKTDFEGTLTRVGDELLVYEEATKTAHVLSAKACSV